jgi:hypothetical protein
MVPEQVHWKQRYRRLGALELTGEVRPTAARIVGRDLTADLMRGAVVAGYLNPRLSYRLPWALNTKALYCLPQTEPVIFLALRHNVAFRQLAGEFQIDVRGTLITIRASLR